MFLVCQREDSDAQTLLSSFVICAVPGNLQSALQLLCVTSFGKQEAAWPSKPRARAAAKLFKEHGTLCRSLQTSFEHLLKLFVLDSITKCSAKLWFPWRSDDHVG